MKRAFKERKDGKYAQILLWIVLAAMLSGCSVAMALSGEKNGDLRVVRVGATRDEIELHFGTPVETQAEDASSRFDKYAYEIGNEPSAGRAIGHGIMDILTLGWWEVIGTPVELVQGGKQYFTLVYDENDVVTKVIASTPPIRNNFALNDGLMN